MADGHPVIADPEVVNVSTSLLEYLKQEDGEEGPEETQAEDQPETAESGEVEADVEPEEQPAEEAKTWKVRVDGEELDVPEDELVKGYSRQQDYTRKTMKLAEERKTLEAEAAQVRVERARYQERLEAMKVVLDQQMGGEPDWEAIKATTPAEYPVKFADYQRQKAAREKVEAEQERVRQQEMDDRQAQLQARIAEERGRLMDALPEWKNPEVAQKDQRVLIEYGTSLGFTEDELGNLYDHRAVLILDKARRYDEAQKKGKTVLKEKTVPTMVLKPGSPAKPTPKLSAKDAAKKQFEKSHHPKDAAALIETMLDDLDKL